MNMSSDAKPKSKGLDYSKWDNIELSDDEDFECHPNVDKASMIRWKQAEIYRERRERHDKLIQLEKEITLNATVLQELNKIKKSEPDLKKKLNSLKEYFDKCSNDFERDMHQIRYKDRDARWRDVEPFNVCKDRIPTGQYIQKIIKDLDSNVEDADYDKAFEKSLKDLTTEINKRKLVLEKEIEFEKHEANKKLTSENMYHENFDVSSISKPKTTTKTIETIHTPSGEQEKDVAEDKKKNVDAGEADYITSNVTAQFAKLTKIEDSYNFLSNHNEIVSQNQSDEILAEAFRLQMKGNTKACKTYIHQALLLQYCSLLGKDGVALFFKRIKTPNNPANEVYLKDVEETYQRIVARVKVLNQEAKEEEEKEKREGLERLAAATQPDGTLALPRVGDEEDIKRADVFAMLPYNLQRAMLLQDVDEINAALQTLDKDESHRLIGLASEVGLIQLQEEDDEPEGEGKT
ncbi:hsp90 co-chaperone Cdc37 [Clydaea vesicula]|uniref:Hsp90 chaperone protein kinase-targeting subunit n=1 Tax=Clydaea vesicula TaxID=447962 RepID=A0AAD5U0A3_9FUNG|nr:hsp90 co-chaperone Cdc37 [Clydaea vesicula]